MVLQCIQLMFLVPVEFSFLSSFLSSKCTFPVHSLISQSTVVSLFLDFVPLTRLKRGLKCYSLKTWSQGVIWLCSYVVLTFVSSCHRLACFTSQSGEKSKSKHKQRKHRDKGEEGEDGEKKERRKSRHIEGDEGKDRKKSRDEEGDKKKRRRSRHSKAKSDDGEQEGVTYEELWQRFAWHDIGDAWGEPTTTWYNSLRDTKRLRGICYCVTAMWIPHWWMWLFERKEKYELFWRDVCHCCKLPVTVDRAWLSRGVCSNRWLRMYVPISAEYETCCICWLVKSNLAVGEYSQVYVRVLCTNVPILKQNPLKNWMSCDRPCWEPFFIFWWKRHFTSLFSYWRNDRETLSDILGYSYIHRMRNTLFPRACSKAKCERKNRRIDSLIIDYTSQISLFREF